MKLVAGGLFVLLLNSTVGHKKLECLHLYPHLKKVVVPKPAQIISNTVMVVGSNNLALNELNIQSDIVNLAKDTQTLSSSFEINTYVSLDYDAKLSRPLIPFRMLTQILLKRWICSLIVYDFSSNNCYDGEIKDGCPNVLLEDLDLNVVKIDNAGFSAVFGKKNKKKKNKIIELNFKYYAGCSTRSKSSSYLDLWCYPGVCRLLLLLGLVFSLLVLYVLVLGFAFLGGLLSLGWYWWVFWVFLRCWAVVVWWLFVLLLVVVSLGFCLGTFLVFAAGGSMSVIGYSFVCSPFTFVSFLALQLSVHVLEVLRKICKQIKQKLKQTVIKRKKLDGDASLSASALLRSGLIGGQSETCNLVIKKDFNYYNTKHRARDYPLKTQDQSNPMAARDNFKCPHNNSVGSENSAPASARLFGFRGGSFNELKFRGFDAIAEHTGFGHNHNIMVPFGGDHLVQRAPSHNRLSCSAIWRRNCRSKYGFKFTRNFGSIPASPPFRGNYGKLGLSHHA
ncbi:hypothetical protein IEQ34_009602 [Dendrobium chrysotoxum]|uniref:Transmembrane protein n=1 Tax=Dendrobium chrysotoxum TaxID=161865 RepID=A0AAV7GZL0_DENCH|nr:hypothetical protein IEQ34_009602 [Dendrobium chrysotoxum]